MKTQQASRILGIFALLAVFGLSLLGCPQEPSDPPNIPVTGVILEGEITLLEGETHTLNATIEPGNASNKSISWESDNEGIATVSDTGVVTAIAIGTATITVTTEDGSFEDTCTVTVTPLPTSIQVTNEPTNTNVAIGEQLDITGLVVTATFSDGSTEPIPITLNHITGFNPNTVGEQTLTIHYGSRTTTFKVTVIGVTKIEITKQPAQVLCKVGEEIDFTEFEVTATYNNGETAIIHPDNWHISSFDNTAAKMWSMYYSGGGTQTVTITYGEQAATFEVRLIDFTQLQVINHPTKTVYRIGEEFDLDGLEVEAVYTDYVQRDGLYTYYPEPLEIKPEHITFDNTQPGYQDPVIIYKGYTCYLLGVMVLAVSKIEVAINSGLDHVMVGLGEQIDVDDITVTATWKNDGDDWNVIIEPVTITLANISGFNPNTLGTQTVTVTYGGKTATFEVLILGVTNIEITEQPNKTRYVIGETLNLDGLEVTAAFANGNIEAIHHDALHISGFNNTQPGTQTITVSYGGYSDTFTITVIGITNIEITSPPTKTEYKVGEQLELAGLIVIATYTDGPGGNTTVTEPAVITMAHITGFNSSTPGTKTITVTYSGHSDTFTVTVVRNYTVTFWIGSTYSTVSVAEGDTVTKPSDPAQLGYGFIGWYKETALTNAWDFNTDIVTADTIIYAKWSLTYNLGDTGPGGGKIFYRSEEGFTMTDTGETCHYLEAAPNDLGAIGWWATYNTTFVTGTATEIGTGRKNTTLIAANGASAARDCSNYRGGDKDDWFLPSTGELNQLYENRASVGNLKTTNDSYYETDCYWSSTQFSTNLAGYQDFSSGVRSSAAIVGSTNYYSVRAIRAF